MLQPATPVIAGVIHDAFAGPFEPLAQSRQAVRLSSFSIARSSVAIASAIVCWSRVLPPAATESRASAKQPSPSLPRRDRGADHGAEVGGKRRGGGQGSRGPRHHTRRGWRNSLA